MTDEKIVQAVHTAHATGQVVLTFIDQNGEERPTNVLKTFLRELQTAAGDQHATQPQEAAERGSDLAEQWKRELIAEMTERRNKARSAADACKEGGWYRRQIETQVARYDDILAALTASEAKSAELEPQ